MEQKKTAQQKAEERYDCETSYIELRRGEGFANCYRREVEPRDRLIQELVDGMMEVNRYATSASFVPEERQRYVRAMEKKNALLAKAKEQFGIEPSNQK